MLNKNYSTEKILLIVALILFAGIIFFNAFYKSDASIPSVIYINENTEDTSKNKDDTSSENNTDKININASIIKKQNHSRSEIC